MDRHRPEALRLRPATEGDARLIARYVILAGGGLFEFMFEGLVPGKTPLDVLTHIAGEPDSLFSHRRCRIAERGGEACGLLNTYPADLIRGETFAQLPPDRRGHLAAFPEVQDWGSLYLSALAVEPAHRRKGIGRALLAGALAEAAAAGFPRLSLHVWDDNRPAAALYAAAGFRRLAPLAIPWHARLPHRGGMWLLSCPATPEPPAAAAPG